MTDLLALLGLPFLAAVCLVGIHTWFGIEVLRRNVIFVDLALAQIAALGATTAFMLGHPAMSTATYAYSFGFTCAAALLLAFTRQWAGRIPQEAMIGVIYVVAAAAALVLIDRAPQGAEHLRQILTGSILNIGVDELIAMAPLYAAIGGLHWLLRRRLLAAHADWRWEFLFYASFGAVVTSSVALAGVLLVFSFLIMPAAIGVLYADSLGRRLAVGWVAGCAASAIGLAASYAWDLPTGAAMVCAFGLTLALAAAARPLLRAASRAAVARQALLSLRWGSTGAMLASGLWLMAAPRADQPLLDLAEASSPALRAAYMAPRELNVFDDAAVYAERYRRQAEALNALEGRRRFEGKQLDDTELARISSFLKSYGEMSKGEEFVMREVRSRARERVRWVAGSVAILLALLIAPGWARRIGRSGARKRAATLPRAW
jgi:zinc/manganese transport system permease protein